MSLALRNLLFTVVVPGTGGAYVPWLILTRHGVSPAPVAWPAVGVIAAGVLLYLWCLWVFAVVGRGTPGPWDPPRRLVAVGPYRWIRNPIYLAALLVVLARRGCSARRRCCCTPPWSRSGSTCWFGYEESRLRAQFGKRHQAYRRAVPRWIPRPPVTSAGRGSSRQ
jgi:protein-S-isoprenylcysteine O-methyltransferase Ste14